MLIFLHIPKTGGTSIIRALSGPKTTILAAKEIGDLYNDVQKPFELAAQKSNVIIGHFPYGVHRYISRSYDYATVLRHPIERVFSDFKYTQKVDKHVAKEFAKRGFTNYVENCWLAQNTMVRILSGHGLAYKNEITKEDYKVALTNLANIKYLGFTHRLIEFYNRLKNDFGFKRTLRHHNKGANISFDDIPLNKRTLIEKYNEWDMLLYTTTGGLRV